MFCYEMNRLKVRCYNPFGLNPFNGETDFRRQNLTSEVELRSSIQMKLKELTKTFMIISN